MKLKPENIHIILEYLLKGGKVKMDGRTYVWLNDHVVSETDTHVWTIDGLAVEGRKYKAGEDWEDPNAGEVHYMGCRDMTLPYFFKLTNDIHPDEFFRVCLDLNRIRKEERSNSI